MVQTKQTGLIRCLLCGYKRAKGLVGNICILYRKLGFSEKFKLGGKPGWVDSS